MTLIRETPFCGNLGKAEFSIPNHFDRTLQSQINDAMTRAIASVVSGVVRNAPNSLDEALLVTSLSMKERIKEYA